MIDEAISALQELEQDSTTPRNVREKIKDIILSLQKEGETPVIISRVLHKLEEISEDTNMESYTRMQLFNISSILESAK